MQEQKTSKSQWIEAKKKIFKKMFFVHTACPIRDAWGFYGWCHHPPSWTLLMGSHYLILGQMKNNSEGSHTSNYKLNLEVIQFIGQNIAPYSTTEIQEIFYHVTGRQRMRSIW